MLVRIAISETRKRLIFMKNKESYFFLSEMLYNKKKEKGLVL